MESRVQIVVPIYNEGENILRLYNELIRAKVSFDLLKFVYDFDGDTTLPFIQQLHGQDGRVVGEKNEFGRGVVNALRWGFAKASTGPVIVVMGDNSDKLEIIPAMVQDWKNGATVVSPSRYMKGGEQHGGGFVKSNLSRIAGLSLRLLGLPTSDATNNFKLYDGDWVSRQQVESVGGFEVALELTYKAYAQRKKIVQLPTVWTDRTYGKSNFKLMKWLPHYLKWYFRAVGALLGNHIQSLCRRAAPDRSH